MTETQENKVLELLSSGEAFALYQLPGQHEQHLISGSTSTSWQASGFVFAPFSNAHPTFFIQADQVLVGDLLQVLDKDLSETDTNSFPQQISTKDEYLKQGHKLLEHLQEHTLQKAVFSRVKSVDRSPGFSSWKLFAALCKKYPHAFVFSFYHPKAGHWLGASPETLVQAEGMAFKTTALASTRPYLKEIGLEHIDWNPKERKEQELVAEYVANNLSALPLKHLEQSETYNFRAGNLVHRKTDFSGELHTVEAEELAQVLHPTPAVCGLPKQNARTAIETVEEHDRRYYTGYLGPVHLADKTQLFVNLRSMEITPEHLLLYVGGGYTAESVPEQEWQETELKTQTLLSVIENL